MMDTHEELGKGLVFSSQIIPFPGFCQPGNPSPEPNFEPPHHTMISLLVLCACISFCCLLSESSRQF